MFIELVETLRCVREHEDSWLVASIDDLRDRSIRKGTLGCPVCAAEYPINEGVADFSAGAPRRSSSSPLPGDSSDFAVRAGAFLSLAGTSGTIVLGGEWARGAAELVNTTDVRVIAVNAPAGVRESPAIALIEVSDVIPLAAKSCAGAALDETFSAEAFLSAQRIVRPEGRVVGARSARRPDGWTIIAEDSSWWIAEKPPAVTTLRRGNR